MGRKPCNPHKDHYRNLHRTRLRPIQHHGQHITTRIWQKWQSNIQPFSLAGMRSSPRGRTRVCWHGPLIWARGGAWNANPATPTRTTAEIYTAHDRGSDQQLHQPWTQQAGNNEAGDTSSQCAPRAQAERPNTPTRFGLIPPVTVQQNRQ